MNNNQIALPIDVNVYIDENDPVRTLHYITERLDYTELNKLYYKNGVYKTYEPKLLFQLIVLAYMNQIFSSRKIESACKKDITFMWLLQGQKAPDHNTFNRFRQEVSSVIDNLFAQFIHYLISINEVKVDHVYIDGTKLESFANKYTFVWKKSTNKHNQKLNEKIISSIESINLSYGKTYKFSDESSIELITEIVVFLEQQIIIHEIELVSGKGKRKTQLQRDLEQFEEYLSKKQKYSKYLKTMGARNSFSKTDPDATFMHMKEDHMRNSQLKPGYNIQAAATGGYCVGVEIFSERSDQLTLIPFLIHLENKLRLRFKDIVADAGYESEENYKFLEENKLLSYIKPSNYERSKKRTYKHKINLRENMDYDPIEDTYICKNNKKLVMIGKSSRTSKSGYISEVKRYKCESCDNCVIKEKCTKSKGDRQIYVSDEFIRLRNQSTDNITTLKGKTLRMNRSIQIEGLFGVMKEDYGFRRLLTKGKEHISAEVKLLMFAFNLNKLNQRIRKNELGFRYYSLKAG